MFLLWGFICDGSRTPFCTTPGRGVLPQGRRPVPRLPRQTLHGHHRGCQAAGTSRPPAPQPLSPHHGTPHGTPPPGDGSGGLHRDTKVSSRSERGALWSGIYERGLRRPLKPDTTVLPPLSCAAAAGNSSRAKRFIPPLPLPAAAPERSLDGDRRERDWPRSLPLLRLYFILFYFFFNWTYSHNIKVCLWDPAIVRPLSCTAREMFYCFPMLPDRPRGPAPAALTLCFSRRGRTA